MAQLDFLRPIHTGTVRNYLERVIGVDKATCARIAKRFDREYWDGDRRYGYGGYRYDGRWQTLARALVDWYQLPSKPRILDVGCGKGYLLHEILHLIPEANVCGLDVSHYALDDAIPTVGRFLRSGTATDLPWRDQTFDLVISINTLHNLHNFDLNQALREMQRVGKAYKYLVVDSYRTEREKVNLLYWQLTCACFYTPEEWQWLFEQSGYTGDFGFIFYE